MILFKARRARQDRHRRVPQAEARAGTGAGTTRLAARAGGSSARAGTGAPRGLRLDRAAAGLSTLGLLERRSRPLWSRPAGARRAAHELHGERLARRCARGGLRGVRSAPRRRRAPARSGPRPAGPRSLRAFCTACTISRARPSLQQVLVDRRARARRRGRPRARRCSPPARSIVSDHRPAASVCSRPPTEIPTGCSPRRRRSRAAATAAGSSAAIASAASGISLPKSGPSVR